MDRAEVLVVGGGPVGLGLAVELGLRGIRTLLIEQSDRAARQPRAKTTNVRSMETMRRWGVAQRIRDAAPLPPGYPTDVVFATRLFGHRLAKFHNAFFGTQHATQAARDERFAERAQWIPQYKVEAALRARAAELPGVALRFGTRLDGIAQDADGVVAEVTEPATGTRRTLRAAYAIGADGARSAMRQAIGARMEGRHAYAQHVNLVIRAPALREAMQREPAIMYWLVNPDAAGFCGPMEGDDLWFFMFALAPGEAVPDHDALRDRLDRAFGRRVGAEILVVDPWSAHSLIADRYRAGRILLAGDACHLHPPFGGYGMNLGIGDAVDLGWKLAAVLRGWGGARLLDSYEAERRPGPPPGHRGSGREFRPAGQGPRHAPAGSRWPGRRGRARGGRRAHPGGQGTRVPRARRRARHALRRIAHRGGGGSAAAAGRPRALRALRRAGRPRAASLARGRAVAVRPVRPGLHPAGLRRRRRTGGRAAGGRGAQPRLAAARRRTRRSAPAGAVWRASRAGAAGWACRLARRPPAGRPRHAAGPAARRLTAATTQRFASRAPHSPDRGRHLTRRCAARRDHAL
jgi:2-polyprenyl-6-methoxyphenol hydroxylase-like FAD-dependent oxidoreductase